jgi:hypothetical protein
MVLLLVIESSYRLTIAKAHAKVVEFSQFNLNFEGNKILQNLL